MGELHNMIAPCDEFEVVVIGSGPAGQNAALEAAERGARVLIIEQEPRLGGACVQYGTIPSKTLRETAITLTAFQRRSGDVYQVTHDSELSVISLMRRLNEVVHAHQETTRLCLERAGVRCATGRARFLSAHQIEVTHVSGVRSAIGAGIVVIATGSRPRNPEHVAVDHENILDSDSILSMTYLPQSILIFGAGVIACEYASTFAALGVKVTMLDRGSRPLAFLDAELTSHFLRQLEAAGGQFVGDAQLSSVRWDGISAVRAELQDGTRYSADKAFVALGRIANIDTLAIDQVGLQASDRGLLTVNQYCQTSVPHIYAVGDTIGPPALASVSMAQGRRAVCHALTGRHHSDPGTLPAGIYTIPEIATVGLSEAQAIEAVGCPIVARVDFSMIARAHIMASSGGILKMISDPEGHRLLGVQIAGDGATELIHLGQMALMGNLPVDTFAHATFNFPTMAEAYRLAALEILHIRDSTRARRGRMEDESPPAGQISERRQVSATAP